MSENCKNWNGKKRFSTKIILEQLESVNTLVNDISLHSCSSVS